jgi:hypothetical protein
VPSSGDATALAMLICQMTLTIGASSESTVGHCHHRGLSVTLLCDRVLPHQLWGHAPRRTPMYFGDVRGETVGGNLLATEPAESLAWRNVHALHSHQA